jgi:cytochrome c2
MRTLGKALSIAVLASAVASVGQALAVDNITYFSTDTPQFRASAKFGKQMFVAYQCAKCHATREDQPLNDDIVAPNLILSKDRLRPEWILHWLIDPQSLQPGTKMPNFFSFNEDDDYNPIYSDADAHVQYKIIVALRDYLMILGTPADDELDRD